MTINRGSLIQAATGNPPGEYVRRMAAVGFDVTVDDLTGRSRAHPLVDYRHVTMAAIRRMTPLSLPTIGRLFDHRDHTTVMHAVTKVENGRHYPAGSKRRRLWETMDNLCHEVRKQWAIDTGRSFPDPDQMDLEELAANTAPSVVFT